MTSEAVQPLRITKSNSSASPNRMSGSAIPRPLSEISPMGIRRNSPSFSQASKGFSPNRDSSPFDASPLNNSPRLYWKERESLSPGIFDTENVPVRTASPSPTRRSSLENLMKASRVKNNNMFLREQQQSTESETSQPMNKPMAKLRPFSTPLQGNGLGSPSFESSLPMSPPKGHRRADSTINLPQLTPSYIPIATTRLGTPLKESSSPQKSSLSTISRYAGPSTNDNDGGIASDDENDENASPTRAITPRASRQLKTVSFDVAPPHINEYERPTPEPSSLASDSREGSYDSDPFDLEETYERATSEEREDSFDDALEDIEQTPVVLPEDWRFMRPGAANTDLAESFDDPFEQQQAQASPVSRNLQFLQSSGLARSDSVASNGESRPLPPLPGISTREQRGQKQVPNRFGLLPSTQRLFPTPPPAAASISKDEVLQMQDRTMTLAERMRLLNVDDHNVTRTNVAREKSPGEDSAEPLNLSKPVIDAIDVEIPQEVLEAVMLQGPPRISRESIMREVKTQMQAEEEDEDADDEDAYEIEGTSEVELQHPSLDYANLDPDIPIPSRETSSNYEALSPKPRTDNPMETATAYNPVHSNVIFSQGSYSPAGGSSRQSSIIHHSMIENDEYNEASSVTHSETTVHIEPASQGSELQGTSESYPFTLALSQPVAVTYEDAKSFHDRIAIPDFAPFETEDFGLSLQSYMTPTLEKTMTFEPLVRGEFDSSVRSTQLDLSDDGIQPHQAASQVQDDVLHESLAVERPFTPEDQVFDVASNQELVMESNSEDERAPTPELAEVPEPVATIRTPGGKFKTRKSATPADMDSMAAARRVVSGEPIPPIPEKHRLRPCTSYELREINRTQAGQVETDIEEEDEKEEKEEAVSAPLNRRQSFKYKLDVGNGVGDGLDGFGLNQEFDRLIEAQKVQLFPPPTYATFPPKMPGKKGNEDMNNTNIAPSPNVTDNYIQQRGYLMRQNTKVVVASNRQLSGDIDNLSSVTGSLASDKTTSTAPRRPSGKTWTTEPWNGKMRRQSTRRGSVVPVNQGPVPPLPGQESNAVESMQEEDFDELDGTGERGRLFVKVIGVKNLNLPLPRNERTSFQLTLDNGLHCVTTSWLELGKSAPIGQEFELTVFDDLEFHLTLQTKLTKPKARPTSTTAPYQPHFKPTKTSTLSRLLVSPKKRREQEKKQQEEEEQAMMQHEREVEALRAVREQPTAWDLLHETVGEDGSFARAYVSLQDHEADAFGRATIFNLDCWNEWALEDKAYASTRSKLGGIQRRPPYKIGTLEVQMLYIPKPKNAKDEDMPKSMSAAIRQLKEAEVKSAQQFEGFLSQQGGDCPYWRRRFFKLDGSKLTSYHETTRQRRATINLARASRLIDDRPSLTQNIASPTKGRRKSAFAEDEEGYMFVEEGFRIRFSNGEVIDFYADSAQHKDEWMRVLCEVVGKDAAGGDSKKSWVEAVRQRQQQVAAAPATVGQKEKGVSQIQRKQVEVAKPTPIFNPPKPPTRRTSRSAPTSPIRSDTFAPSTSAPTSNTLEEYMMTRAATSQVDKPLPTPSHPSLIERAKEKAAQHMRHKSQPEGLGTSGLQGFIKRSEKPDGTSNRGRRQMIKSMIF